MNTRPFSFWYRGRGKRGEHYENESQIIFHYVATGNTPAMEMKIVGGGTQYLFAERDSEGRYLDGGKNYRMYGPLEPWFDKTWKLGDFELVK